MPLRFGDAPGGETVPAAGAEAQVFEPAELAVNAVRHEQTPVAPAGVGHVPASVRPSVGVTTDWRRGLPELAGRLGLVRELRLADAPTLFAMLTAVEVARFISPPPATLEGFERFIAWSHRRREEGSCVGFAIVPYGLDGAVGVIQVRQLEASWSTAEWGFALGSPFWGTGLFVESARLVVDFAFTALGVHRLEARAAARNGRGNGALAKLGAVREGVLRQAFRRDGECSDQVLWSILREDWMQSKAVWTASVH
jgi:ribosomal-protein-alanine N-acetyltransferase